MDGAPHRTDVSDWLRIETAGPRAGGIQIVSVDAGLCDVARPILVGRHGDGADVAIKPNIDQRVLVEHVDGLKRLAARLGGPNGDKCGGNPPAGGTDQGNKVLGTQRPRRGNDLLGGFPIGVALGGTDGHFRYSKLNRVIVDKLCCDAGSEFQRFCRCLVVLMLQCSDAESACPTIRA